MSQDTVSEAAPATTTTTSPTVVTVQSPPAAPMPAREQLPDPRARLLQLAAELMRSSSNHRLVVEYLRLRRAVA